MDKFRLFLLEKLLLHCISIIEDVRKKQFFQQQSTSINLCCASRFAKEQKEDYLCCNQDQENKWGGGRSWEFEKKKEFNNWNLLQVVLSI